MVGEDGGSQAGWWLGGEEAQKGLKLPGGEQAMEVMGLLLLCRLSEVRSLENMASASGKLGGVAGVLLGVHICRAQENGAVSSPTGAFGGVPNPPAAPRPIAEDPACVPHLALPPRPWVAPPKVWDAWGEAPANLGRTFWIIQDAQTPRMRRVWGAAQTGLTQRGPSTLPTHHTGAPQDSLSPSFLILFPFTPHYSRESKRQAKSPPVPGTAPAFLVPS